MQQVFQFGQRDFHAVEIARVWPDGDFGAGFFFAAHQGARCQRFGDFAVGEGDLVLLFFAPDGDFDPSGQRIGHGNAHAVQSAGKGIGVVATLGEFSAGMQTGENDFDCRHFFFRMDAHRNAAAVVFHTDAAVGVDGDGNVVAIAADGFVGCVVDHFGHDMQRVFRTGVHAGTLPDRLESFQDADRLFAVCGFFLCHDGVAVCRFLTGAVDCTGRMPDLPESAKYKAISGCRRTVLAQGDSYGRTLASATKSYLLILLVFLPVLHCGSRFSRI